MRHVSVEEDVDVQTLSAAREKAVVAREMVRMVEMCILVVSFCMMGFFCT